MAKKKKIPPKYQKWIDARKKYKLSHARIEMARKLGMNPKRFGKLDNNDQERWKLPLGDFIEKCYLKAFGELPDKIVTRRMAFSCKWRERVRDWIACKVTDQAQVGAGRLERE